jgi:hypothetical protein
MKNKRKSQSNPHKSNVFYAASTAGIHHHSFFLFSVHYSFFLFCLTLLLFDRNGGKVKKAEIPRRT